MDVFQIMQLQTPHEFLLAVTNLSSPQQKALAQQLAWKLGEGTVEDKRKLKEALNMVSLVPK